MRLLTRSRAAKNNVAIFILFTAFPAKSRPLLCLTTARWKKFPQENVFEKLVAAEFFRGGFSLTLAGFADAAAYLIEVCQEPKGSNQNGAARITVAVQ
jgi:hypothetical protein